MVTSVALGVVAPSAASVVGACVVVVVVNVAVGVVVGGGDIVKVCGC